jgi:hypothetical protein
MHTHIKDILHYRHLMTVSGMGCVRNALVTFVPPSLQLLWKGRFCYGSIRGNS